MDETAIDGAIGRSIAAFQTLEDQFRRIISFCTDGRGRGAAHTSMAGETFADTIQRAEKIVHPFINRWGGQNAPSIRAQFQDAIDSSRLLDQRRNRIVHSALAPAALDSVVAGLSEVSSALDVVHRQLMHWYRPGE